VSFLLSKLLSGLPAPPPYLCGTQKVQVWSPYQIWWLISVTPGALRARAPERHALESVASSCDLARRDQLANYEHLLRAKSKYREALAGRHTTAPRHNELDSAERQPRPQYRLSGPKSSLVLFLPFLSSSPPQIRGSRSCGPRAFTFQRDFNPLFASFSLSSGFLPPALHYRLWIRSALLPELSPSVRLQTDSQLCSRVLKPTPPHPRKLIHLRMRWVT
jgi:hypothetical protein